jgi:hypothetical protein
MGDILSKARRDWQRFSQSSVNTEITFETPDAVSNVTVLGIAMKIHLSLEQENREYINTRHAHVTVSEQLLIDAAYPTRNTTTGDVDMLNHRITYTDSTGTARTYLIREVHQDETVGILVFVLGTFEP